MGSRGNYLLVLVVVVVLGSAGGEIEDDGRRRKTCRKWDMTLTRDKTLSWADLFWPFRIMNRPSDFNTRRGGATTRRVLIAATLWVNPPIVPACRTASNPTG